MFGKLEQVADLIKLEAKLAGMAYERKPPHMAITIKAPTVLAARRGGQQSLGLVETDGRYLQSGLPGHGTDRQHLA
jgi:hypothetical protein